MLTEREVLALERVKDKMRKLRDKISEAQGTLREITEDLGNYDFDPEVTDEQLSDLKAELSDAILLIETDIEEYDEMDDAA